MGETKLISLRLAVDVLAEVDQEAEVDSRSRSQVIELRLREAYGASRQKPSKPIGGGATENGRRRKETNGANHQPQRDLEPGNQGSGESGRGRLARGNRTASAGRVDLESNSPTAQADAKQKVETAVSAVTAIGEQVVTAAELDVRDPSVCRVCGKKMLDFGSTWRCASCGRNDPKCER